MSLLNRQSVILLMAASTLALGACKSTPDELPPDIWLFRISPRES